MLVAVALSSMRAVRQRLSYEAWYGLHLYAYLAVALAFLHEILVGRDFLDDPIATGYWVALYVLAFGLIATFRLGAPLVLNLRHRLVVDAVVPEAPGIVSVYLRGRDLASLAVSAGQFFQWRFLTGGGWWRPHPYSLSAAPDGQQLRITIKDLGDDSRLIHQLRPGVRALAEGPYGAFTASRLTRRAALFIAGGIGITPLRAIIDELPPGTDAVLLYRATTWHGLVFRRELEAAAADRGLRIIYLVGRRGSPELPTEPLAAEAIRRAVPDIGDRDVFVCGSNGFLSHVRSSLRKLGLRGDQVHAERFAF
jgi:ferredoxin-NADP reductase